MDGIWIRSQNKVCLVFCGAIDAEEDAREIIGQMHGNYAFMLGTYNVKGRTKEIIDDIQKHIFNGVHEVYQMPEE
jgi:hypothetical protein